MTVDPPPLLPGASRAQTTAILGAMRAVAETGGPASRDDRLAPVIFSWHLKRQVNPVARDASGALDPQEFWHAWAAGAAATGETFAPDWDFWRYADQPIATLQERWAIPAAGISGSPAH